MRGGEEAPPAVGAAVILAAGSGSRLRGVLPDRPKALLELGGVTLLERSLDILRSACVPRVVLVAGHHAGAFGPFVDRRPVEVVVNPDHLGTGSMRSLYAAGDHVDGDFLLLESDLLYEPRAVTDLLRLPPGDWLLLSGPTGQGDEVYAYGGEMCLDLLTKARLPDREPVGEYVGMGRLTRSLLEAMCRRHEAVAADCPGYHYDDCLSDLCGTRTIRPHLAADLVWAEIDDAAQLQRAVERVLPALSTV